MQAESRPSRDRSVQVLAEAARVDAGSCPDGLLAGVPFAVKDVIDTSDYPTAYGSPIYTGHQPRLDAACVRLARRQGAVVMGKVATGEFATQTPSLARNPLRTTHTPGGSSSGSAAAVAAGMVPVAFGTQTTGSIVRPAVYCGVVGYKPSFGMIGAAGMKTLSHTQDTIGVIARDVADVAFFTLGLHGTRPIMQGVSPGRGSRCAARANGITFLPTHITRSKNWLRASRWRAGAWSSSVCLKSWSCLPRASRACLCSRHARIWLTSTRHVASI